MDETREIRDRLTELEDLISRLEAQQVPAGKAMSCQTVSGGSYPTAPGNLKTFYVQGYDITGVETEGGTGSEASTTGSFFAVMIGSGLPAVGTRVLAYHTGTAWVFPYYG